MRLSAAERDRLDGMIRCGKHAAQALMKARILLAADLDGPGLSDGAIVEALGPSRPSVERLRRRLVEEGLDAALVRKRQERPSPTLIFDGEAGSQADRARLLAAAQRTGALDAAPAGEKVIELAIVPRTSDNTIGRTLKKTRSSRICAGNG